MFDGAERSCEPDCGGYADYAAVPCPNPACDDRVRQRWQEEREREMTEEIWQPMPENACWNCGYVMDATTGISGREIPRAGDVGICVGCGSFGIFTESGTLRKPGPLEEMIISQDREAMAQQRTVQAYRARMN